MFSNGVRRMGLEMLGEGRISKGCRPGELGWMRMLLVVGRVAACVLPKEMRMVMSESIADLCILVRVGSCNVVQLGRSEQDECGCEGRACVYACKRNRIIRKT